MPTSHRRTPAPKPRLRSRLSVAALQLHPSGRRGQLTAASAVVVLTAVLLAFVLTGHTPRPVGQAAPPPQPTVSTGGHAPTSARPAPAKTPFACAKPRRTTGTSAPTRICVPHIRVDATVMSLGLNADRTVEVPPLSKVRDAGWYKYSAAPGAVGPTVVLGHVNSAQYGDGVFVDLNRVRAGDRVVVTRGDGRVAVYRVDRMQQVEKSSFPSLDVYGPTSGPALRMVTCGGRFDASSGSYESNIIAYGTLLSLSRG